MLWANGQAMPKSTALHTWCVQDISHLLCTWIACVQCWFYLGFSDIWKSQTSAGPWILIPRRASGGTTSSCFALSVNLFGCSCTKSYGSRAVLDGADLLVCRRSFFNMSFTGICKDNFTDLWIIDSFGRPPALLVWQGMATNDYKLELTCWDSLDILGKK